MQSVKVLVVLLALSQVECAPPSIWPAHRFSPPALWPFKQPSAPSPLFFSTHFPAPGSLSAPAEVALPAEVVVSEPVVDTGITVIAEVIPEESALPVEVVVIPEELALPVEVVAVPEEPSLPVETTVPEVLVLESVPQPQEPVISTSENVLIVQEIIAAPVTEVPVAVSTTTTVAPPSFRDSDTFKAYEQFINTWLTTASITLNRPNLLNMVTNTKPKTISTGKLPVKQSVEKSVERVVEQVTVSESFEPKKVSGLPKKTPATIVSTSITETPIVNIPVTEVKPVALTEPVPSLDVAAPFEPLRATVVASALTSESLNTETVVVPELIVFEPIPENSPVQEQVITEVFESIPENLIVKKQVIAEVFESIPETPLVQEQVIAEVFESIPETPLVQEQVIAGVFESIPETPLVQEPIIAEVELIEVPSSLKPVAAPELIAFEPAPENLPIQEHTITEVDLVAEPSILQPVVVSQPTVREFVLAAKPQLAESSYSNLPVSTDGTVLVAPNPPASSNLAPAPFNVAPASPSVAQPSLVAVAPEPAQPRVIESFSPKGLTYTLRLFPNHGSSFSYSHSLGG